MTSPLVDPMGASVDSNIKRANLSSLQSELASLLVSGDLVLLLGAGASAGVGLPSWDDLATGVASRCGVETRAPMQANQLLSLCRLRCDEDTSKGNAVFLAHVRDTLYENVRSDDGFSNTLLVERLLIAIGAIVMSSMRGSTIDIYTLNLDDVLDWYLHLHGFRTQIVTDMPSPLHGNVDARILHLHGFLPLQGMYSASRWTVLTEDEYVGRLAESGSTGWSNLFLSALQTKRVLVIGTSFHDTDIQVLFQKTVGDSGRHCGYAMIVPSSDTDENTLAANRLKQAGLKPINLPSHAEYPEFLLGVCRRAAIAEG